MSIRQNSLIVATLTIFVGGSVVLAEPLLNNNKQSSFDSQQLLAQTETPQNQRRRGNQEKSGGRGRILQELNLTEQQQQQLQEIKEKYQGQMNPLKENLKTVRQELTTMMSGSASTDQIRAKHQQLVALRQQIGNLRFESMLEMRQVLTPEQRSKFAQLMEQRHNNSRQRMRNSSDSEE